MLLEVFVVIASIPRYELHFRVVSSLHEYTVVSNIVIIHSDFSEYRHSDTQDQVEHLQIVAFGLFRVFRGSSK